MKQVLSSLSPVLKEYMEYQLKYPDAIICFEIGVFYEVYQLYDYPLGFAKLASEVTDVVLTRRSKEKKDSIYMAGFPSHTIDNYVKKMLKAGLQVVIVSQKKTIKNGKPYTERFLDRICSPGTVIENLSAEKSNYYASLYKEDNIIGVTLIDISTGEVQISEILEQKLNDYLLKIQPSEILITGELNLNFPIQQNVHKNIKQKTVDKLDSCGNILGNFYKLKSPTSNPKFHLSQLGLERWRLGSLSFGNLINYLSDIDVDRNLLMKMSRPKVFNSLMTLEIPLSGMESLNVTGDNSLISVLDKCGTAMGRRLLRNWINHPLNSSEDINLRMDQVDRFIKNNIDYPQIKSIYDIQRLSRKIITQKIMPHEFGHIISSLKISLEILKDEKENNNELSEFIDLIESNIDLETILMSSEKSYNYFRGDLLKQTLEHFNKLKESESRIDSLKNHYEKIIKEKVNPKYNLKIISLNNLQQLAGTKGLKNEKKFKELGFNIDDRKNDFLINEKDWIEATEQHFIIQQQYLLKSEKTWMSFLKFISENYYSLILETAQNIAEIDVLLNFAHLSKKHNYVRPQFIESDQAYFNFEKIRHPIIEQSKKLRESFVANDVELGGVKNIMCLYGANSSGKSTLLRSVALNILMAHIGCFVSANKAEMTTFDSILTRMSMSDNIDNGESTFVVEMKEFNYILNFLNKKTLMLLDEIGRGTSAHEGEAIAFAALDYISNKQDNRSVGFFATHYHDLSEKLTEYNNIVIKHIHGEIVENKMVFTRKIQDGAGNGSYGIAVAEICGLPETIIRVAKNYKTNYAPLVKSHYNSRLEGFICPICKKNKVEETNHIIEQKQGTVKKVNIDGVEKSVHDLANLELICASCHHKITHKKG